MYAADALQEMLLYSEDGTLQFFPAIPEEWQEETVSFTGFLAGNGLLVSASREGGRLVSVTLLPRRSGDVRIKNWASLSHLALSGGTLRLEDGDALLTLTAGQACTLRQVP